MSKNIARVTCFDCGNIVVSLEQIRIMSRERYAFDCHSCSALVGKVATAETIQFLQDIGVINHRPEDEERFGSNIFQSIVPAPVFDDTTLN
jgi:hypothetical protein